VALALRAGALVSDLEFVQFHPTVLYTGAGARGRCPLVTEAVRGEGAVLVDATGARVMAGVHPLEDLAPRDVVSAAITRRFAELGDDHVFLDATHLNADTFRRRFPTVYAACRTVGVDPAVAPIPVAPAAHFSCGGILSTVDGRTTVPGLYAAGEVARTGLHGANRLASNSLLEGLVVGARAAHAVAEDLATGQLADPRYGIRPTIPVAPVAERDVLQRVMSRYAAIGRDAEGLAVVGSVLHVSAVDSPLTTRQLAEDAALTLTARALIASAAERAESRGCHVRLDFPSVDDAWRHSLRVRLTPSGQPVLTGRALLRSAA
jgi:L-aspartate oxidase